MNACSTSIELFVPFTEHQNCLDKSLGPPLKICRGRTLCHIPPLICLLKFKVMADSIFIPVNFINQDVDVIYIYIHKHIHIYYTCMYMRNRLKVRSGIYKLPSYILFFLKLCHLAWACVEIQIRTKYTFCIKLKKTKYAIWRC